MNMVWAYEFSIKRVNGMEHTSMHAYETLHGDMDKDFHKGEREDGGEIGESRLHFPIHKRWFPLTPQRRTCEVN